MVYWDEQLQGDNSLKGAKNSTIQLIKIPFFLAKAPLKF